MFRLLRFFAASIVATVVMVVASLMPSAQHEYACHEGNYGLANILSAGRTAEAQTDGRRR
jgi:hypothetical protein